MAVDWLWLRLRIRLSPTRFRLSPTRFRLSPRLRIILSPRLRIRLSLREFSYRLRDFVYRLRAFAYRLRECAYRLREFAYRLREFACRLRDFAYRLREFASRLREKLILYLSSISNFLGCFGQCLKKCRSWRRKCRTKILKRMCRFVWSAGIYFLVHAIFVASKLWIWHLFLFLRKFSATF